MCLPHEHGPLLYCPQQSKCGLPRKGTEGPSVLSDLQNFAAEYLFEVDQQHAQSLPLLSQLA